ncbi:hypothetical protein [Aurantimonas sp. VKM B-3413]|nr:hypothetical protein [Aurantimonas sp. VKM B-3413]MCB8835967.1 hypothetical protein [Aurantimonas sp. VKM B-3413]
MKTWPDVFSLFGDLLLFFACLSAAGVGFAWFFVLPSIGLLWWIGWLPS